MQSRGDAFGPILLVPELPNEADISHFCLSLIPVLFLKESVEFYAEVVWLDISVSVNNTASSKYKWRNNKFMVMIYFIFLCIYF